MALTGILILAASAVTAFVAAAVFYKVKEVKNKAAKYDEFVETHQVAPGRYRLKANFTANDVTVLLVTQDTVLFRETGDSDTKAMSLTAFRDLYQLVQPFDN